MATEAAVFQRLHPRAYFEKFVNENVRPDGRGFDDWRDVSVNVGSISTANGSALVRMGQTTIVCGIKAEIAEPELDRPNLGFLVPNLDLLAISSPKFKPGPPTDEAQVLSERLNEALLLSNILPLESLCIHPGKAVWTLYIDATCINYDGNAFDAALLAMVAALKNAQLPKATYNEDTGKTLCSKTVNAPLDIQRVPISMSFGVFESAHTMTDPTSFEEPLLETSISVITDASNALISVSHLGLGTVAPGVDAAAMASKVLEQCIATAKKRNEWLRENIAGL